MKITITKDGDNLFCRVGDFTDVNGYHKGSSQLSFCTNRTKSEVKRILIDLIAEKLRDIKL